MAERTRTVGQSVLANLAVLLAGRAGALTLQFVAFALLVSHLGPAGFGTYAFAVAFAEMFGLISNFGFRPTVTRDIAQNPARERALIPNLTYLRLALGLVGYGILSTAVVLVGYTGVNRSAALVTGLLLVLLSIESFQTSLEVRLKLGWVAAADSLKAAFILAGVVVLSRADAGVLPFLWLYVAANTFNFSIILVKALRLADFDWRPRPVLWWPLVRASFSVGLSSLLIALYYRLDIAFLARLKHAADVGQYGAAFKFLEIFLLLPALAMSLLAPVLSRSFVEQAGVLQRRYERSVHLITVVSLPVAVGGAMLAWRILPALPGFEAYGPAGETLSVLAPAAAAIFVATIVQGVLIGAHLQRRLLSISVRGFLANVILNVALIPPYSYIGAAVAATATSVFVLVLTIYEVRQRLELRWPLPRLARTALAVCLAAAAAVPGYLLDPFLQLGIGIAAYLVALRLTGAVRRDDLGALLAGGPRWLPTRLSS